MSTRVTTGSKWMFEGVAAKDLGDGSAQLVPFTYGPFEVRKFKLRGLDTEAYYAELSPKFDIALRVDTHTFEPLLSTWRPAREDET
jgi:hypothetical protein